MKGDKPVRKPFAGYDDFEGCLRDNQDKNDPEAFCAWLQERAKEILNDGDAENVLTSLTTEFVSSVDTPAQDSEWLIFKDADTPRRKAREVERPYVFKSRDELRNASDEVDPRKENDDGERQIAYGAVLIPNEPDKQGDVIPPYVVERSAHEYMAKYRKMDVDHDLEDGAGTPVESWVLKQEQTFETPDGDTVTYPAGTWLIGKAFQDDAWERVKNGELTGFSIYGGASTIDVDELRQEVEAVNREKRESMRDGQSKQFGEDEVETIMGVLGGTLTAHRDALTDDIQSDLEDEFNPEVAQEVIGMIGGIVADGFDDIVNEVEAELMDGEDMDGEGEGSQDGEQEQENSKGETDMGDEQTDTPDEGGTDEGNEEVAEGIDELKSMVKGVDEKVDDFDDRLSEVEDEVETLKSNVDTSDGATGNDRLNEGDDEGERLQEAAEKAVKEFVGEVADVEDVDDPDVVRKGLREQVAGGSDDDDDGDDMPQEDYAGVVKSVGDDTETSDAEQTENEHGNKRFAGVSN